MRKESVETIFRALNEASVRYLLAGGLAVVAHGYVRFTADVDLILDLEDENLRRALAALSALGYRPRPPVPIGQFADPQARRRWVADKGLMVLSLYSPGHPTTEIDLFVEPPLDFASAYRSAFPAQVAPGVEATCVSYEDLVRLKRSAGRPQESDGHPTTTGSAGQTKS